MPPKRSRTRKQVGPLTGLSIVPNDDPSPVPGAGEILLLMPVDANAIPGQTLIGAAAFEIEFLMPGTPDDVRAELGIALAMPLFTIRITSPYNWSGYTYECVGAPLAPSGGTLQLDSEYTYKIISTPLLETPSSEEVPLFFWSMVPGSPPCLLLALRRRVYCAGTPVYFEARWTPTTGETMGVLGVEKDPLQKSAIRVHRGITLLREIEHPHRPWGSTMIPEPLFREMYPQVYKDCMDAYTTLPQKKEIAAAFGISEDTLVRYLDSYNLPFPPV